MAICWFCHWGWPKPIADIYQKALAKLDGDESPLHWGPAHVVWEDENFDNAECRLASFGEFENDGRFVESDLAIVKQSLIELAALPESIKVEPDAYLEDDENPQLYPPPPGMEMVKV